jgi:hypothetical protein
VSDDVLGWTIPWACEQFERQGMPVVEARFRITIIRGVRIQRVGETRQPPGSKGGRGQVLYDIGQLQNLHRWYLEGCQITKQDP